MDYGDRIRVLRKERKLSTEKLGKLIGLSQSMVSKLENGERNLDVHTLEKICNVFGITLPEFFNVDNQLLDQLPPDILRLVVNKNNYGLLKQIQAMKNKGYSNEVIIEWLTSLENTLENIKRGGVYWGGEDLEESKKYTEQEKQEIVEGLKKKLSDPDFKPPWRENDV